ncbi:hypothetical protein CSA37_07580 [Candidatus Fermentibacteria bacterium]|nr:MAG: hypothetical protein CSA37_07580 [Candidatus Fermentibacteria bacterium]
MRKVVFALSDLGRGGIQRQVSLLSRSLSDQWEPHIWSMAGGATAREITAAGIDLVIHERKFTKDISPLFKYISYIRKVKPDVVHSWDWMSSFSSFAACRLTGIPHISGSIRLGGLEGMKRRRIPVLLSARLGNLALANNYAGIKAWNIDPNKAKVLYNGFEESRMNGVTVVPVAERPGPFTVVMAAWMAERKDYPSYIEAARLLEKKHGPGQFRCVCLGSGPQMDELMARAGDLISTGTVVFPGKTGEVIPYLVEAHAAVMMSVFGEGISNSIMEYMVCGLPVVCSDNGANREIVVEEETGFFVPPFSSEQLAERLEQLRNNPVMASEMGMTGRETVLNKFGLGKMAGNAEKIYTDLLRSMGRI